MRRVDTTITAAAARLERGLTSTPQPLYHQGRSTKNRQAHCAGLRLCVALEEREEGQESEGRLSESVRRIDLAPNKKRERIALLFFHRVTVSVLTKELPQKVTDQSLPHRP
jgi:hypothetical protein